MASSDCLASTLSDPPAPSRAVGAERSLTCRATSSAAQSARTPVSRWLSRNRRLSRTSARSPVRPQPSACVPTQGQPRTGHLRDAPVRKPEDGQRSTEATALRHRHEEGRAPQVRSRAHRGRPPRSRAETGVPCRDRPTGDAAIGARSGLRESAVAAGQPRCPSNSLVTPKAGARQTRQQTFYAFFAIEQARYLRETASTAGAGRTGCSGGLRARGPVRRAGRRGGAPCRFPRRHLRL